MRSRVALPSFLTILPLLRAGTHGVLPGRGLLAAIGVAEYSFGGLFLLPAAALLAWVGHALDAVAPPPAPRCSAACLLAAGCGNDAQPAPADRPRRPRRCPLRTLYVQAPLSGPAADEGRAMVDAVRLVVDQARRAGRGRCAWSCARSTTAGRRRRDRSRSAAPRNAARAAADPARARRDRHLRAGLQRARAARCCARPGCCSSRRSTPPQTLPGRAPPGAHGGDQGTAAAQLAPGARGHARRDRQPAAGRRGGRSRRLSSAAAAASRHRAGRCELDASASTPRELVGELLDGADPGRRPGRIAGHLGDRPPARDRAAAGGARGPRSSRRRRSTRSRSSTAPGRPPRAFA